MKMFIPCWEILNWTTLSLCNVHIVTRVCIFTLQYLFISLFVYFLNMRWIFIGMSLIRGISPWIDWIRISSFLHGYLIAEFWFIALAAHQYSHYLEQCHNTYRHIHYLEQCHNICCQFHLDTVLNILTNNLQTLFFLIIYLQDL